MSEDQETENRMPDCPLCGAPSRLKEALRHLTGSHYFYICDVCEIQFPVDEGDPRLR